MTVEDFVEFISLVKGIYFFLATCDLPVVEITKGRFPKKHMIYNQF
jgi:hypothetical protein